MPRPRTPDRILRLYSECDHQLICYPSACVEFAGTRPALWIGYAPEARL
jgi:hypothetical protein